MMHNSDCGGSDCTVIWQRRGKKNAAGWDKMLLNLPADCRGKSRAMMVLLHFSSSFCACRWNLCGHTRTPSCGSSAGHSRREAERRVSSPRGSPGGKRVAGSRGSPSSCFHCLEEARGPESRLPVTQNYLPECDCACWEGTLKTVTPLLMCAMYSCRLLLRARLCFSRFNIHLLRVNTVATFSREADTRNLSVSL